jgi:pimeloyl-ACP methyl ester carboxylesterase
MKRFVKIILPALLGAAAMWLALSRSLALGLAGRGEAGNPPPGEVWTLTAADGVTLRASAQAGGENWAVLLHGWGETGESMTALGEEYLARGWSVLIPDLRGCGDSGGTCRGLGAGDGPDVLVWLERLRAEYPEARTVLHGRGLGANAALAAGGGRPEGLTAVIAEDPVPSLGELGEAYLPMGSSLLEWGVRAVLKLYTGRDLPDLCVRRQTAGTGVPILFLDGPVPADAENLYWCAGKGACLLHVTDPRERLEAVFTFLTDVPGSARTP